MKINIHSFDFLRVNLTDESIHLAIAVAKPDLKLWKEAESV